MGGVIKREWLSDKCAKCGGTGAPFIVPGDPTSGHDLKGTCDACGGEGFIRKIKQS